MFIRIVKMQFKEEACDTFEHTFNNYKEKIRSFPGCKHLELLQDKDRSNIYFTYSYWEKVDNLENYRNSDLFKEVWALTKVHFSGKPEAWSVDQKVILE